MKYRVFVIFHLNPDARVGMFIFVSHELATSCPLFVKIPNVYNTIRSSFGWFSMFQIRLISRLLLEKKDHHSNLILRKTLFNFLLFPNSLSMPPV